MLMDGPDVQRAGLYGRVIRRLLHANAGEFGELRRVLRGESRGHVLHEEDRGREVAPESWSEAHPGGWSAGGSAEYDDREALVGGNRRSCARGRRWLGRRSIAVCALYRKGES